jgi:hypothetical protein
VARPCRHHASCGDRREDLTSSLWQFSSSVSRLSGCLAGLPATGREALHVDNRRCGSNSRPDRQLDPSAGDAVLASVFGIMPPTSPRANCGQHNRKRRQRQLLRRHWPPADRGVAVSLKTRQFLLGTAAFGCPQLGNASGPSTTLLRPPSPRIWLSSSNSSKRRNRKTARFRSDT